MGLVGLFVGPVLMALLVSIWREWQREISEDEQRLADQLPAPDAGVPLAPAAPPPQP